MLKICTENNTNVPPSLSLVDFLYYAPLTECEKKSAKMFNSGLLSEEVSSSVKFRGFLQVFSGSKKRLFRVFENGYTGDIFLNCWCNFINSSKNFAFNFHGSTSTTFGNNQRATEGYGFIFTGLIQISL